MSASSFTLRQAAIDDYVSSLREIVRKFVHSFQAIVRHKLLAPCHSGVRRSCARFGKIRVVDSVTLRVPSVLLMAWQMIFVLSYAKEC